MRLHGRITAPADGRGIGPYNLTLTGYSNRESLSEKRIGRKWGNRRQVEGETEIGEVCKWVTYSTELPI
jgi:hypothetical protein